ncbi:tRNA preQ1(34) S-adenosylmethionine ribosyltransferase-isomerase QueA [Paenibacillus sp. y28]|uniref:tRNA preQ1(34) S-adenosylmethionine ribosyltransferase-isomerase QueA n=1 Tax=Paenibacillus sp. y28 TaxID=3129110 RepID=UPI003017ABAA
MNVNEFDFELPEHLIAQTPLKERSKSRLLTLDKNTGETGHRTFEELKEFLQPGDLLVLNNTKVLPARLFGVKADTGAKVEVLLLKDNGEDRWDALVKPGKRIKTGTRIVFYAPGEETPILSAVIEAEGEMGQRSIRFRYEGVFLELLDRVGQMPLPPYIRETLDDKDRYQTVYAQHQGSAAAPTAGLHFTQPFLRQLEESGIRIAYVTLHVGLGTFRPVSADTVEEHRMHSEYYVLPEETAALIRETKQQGGRIIAVGTTSARTLETAARNAEDIGCLEGSSGWTDIFIYPGVELRLVDALLTNFHLPKSTLLMLISAIAGRERILAAYREAVEREYRFFSFGDAMFIY